jgi:hypothetical protein
LHIEFATAPRDDAFVLRAQLQTTQSNLEPSRAFIVADEQIRHAQPEGIKGAACRNPKLTKSRATKILHAGKKSCALNNQAHDCLSASTIQIDRA